jgi:hypothetical protein
LPEEEVTVHTMVGILQWVTGNIFGTHAGEVKALARRMNKQLAEDLRTSIALLHEIHTRKEQGLHFRKLGDGMHIFRPRTSRVEGIRGVSKPRPFEHTKIQILWQRQNLKLKDYQILNFALTSKFQYNVHVQI